MDNRKKLVSSPIHTSPLLTNKMINKIGHQYLKVSQEKEFCTLFSSRANQRAAQALIEYNENTTTYEKWRFLAQTCSTLSNHNGRLASAIKKLFYQSFNTTSDFTLAYPDNNALSTTSPQEKLSYFLNCVISYYFMYTYVLEECLSLDPHTLLSDHPADQISGETIYILAKKYLEKHTTPQPMYDDHLAAKCLLLQPNLDDLTPREKWLLLAKNFIALESSDSQLARDILKLFKTVFNVSIDTKCKTGISSVASVSVALIGVIENHYLKQYMEKKQHCLPHHFKLD